MDIERTTVFPEKMKEMTTHHADDKATIAKLEHENKELKALLHDVAGELYYIGAYVELSPETWSLLYPYGREE